MVMCLILITNLFFKITDFIWSLLEPSWESYPIFWQVTSGLKTGVENNIGLK